MNPVTCNECGKIYKDIGSFINHMIRVHGWNDSDSLIYWGDNYGADEDAGKQGEATETG